MEIRHDFCSSSDRSSYLRGCFKQVLDQIGETQKSLINKLLDYISNQELSDIAPDFRSYISKERLEFYTYLDNGEVCFIFETDQAGIYKLKQLDYHDFSDKRIERPKIPGELESLVNGSLGVLVQLNIE